MQIKLDTDSFHLFPEYPSNEGGKDERRDEKSGVVDKGVDPDILPDWGVGGEEDDPREGVAEKSDASG